MYKHLAVAVVTALSVGTIALRPAFAAPRPAHAEAAVGLAVAGSLDPRALQQAVAQGTSAPHLFADVVTEAARELDRKSVV